MMPVHIPREHDVPLVLDYNPRQYASKGAAARGLYAALRRAAEAEGQDPDTEVMLLTPDQNYEHNGCRCWRVVWEAGPFEWAVLASMQIHGKWGFVEPYYAFDLDFTD